MPQNGRLGINIRRRADFPGDLFRRNVFAIQLAVFVLKTVHKFAKCIRSGVYGKSDGFDSSSGHSSKIIRMNAALGISLMLLFVVNVALLPAGVIFLKRGLWPKRSGDEPHCPQCGYLLIGIAAKNCPECGTPISGAKIVFGQRHRQFGVAATGGAILVFPCFVLVGLLVHGLSIVPWYHYKPTFMVIHDLQSNGAITLQAMNELDRREKSGELSTKYEQQLVEMGLAQQATTSSGLLADGLIRFLEQQYAAGYLTDAQKTRFGQQSVVLHMHIRPIVVLRDLVPFEIAHSSRVTVADYYVRILDDGAIGIDGKTIRTGGSGESSMSGLGSGGASGSSVECNSIGEHHLSVTSRVEVYRGPIGAGILLFKESRTLTGSFQIVAESPPGNFKVIEDPKLTDPIKASIVPVNFQMTGGQSPRFNGELQVTAVPIDIAFNVLARLNGHEYSLGSVNCAKGSSTHYGIGGAVSGTGASTQPSTFDLILRSNEHVARNTVGLHSAWKGELVYPKVPFIVVPGK
jgi:hypothetical protein